MDQKSELWYLYWRTLKWLETDWFCFCCSCKGELIAQNAVSRWFRRLILLWTKNKNNCCWQLIFLKGVVTKKMFDMVMEFFTASYFLRNGTFAENVVNSQYITLNGLIHDIIHEKSLFSRQKRPNLKGSLEPILLHTLNFMRHVIEVNFREQNQS